MQIDKRRRRARRFAGAKVQPHSDTQFNLDLKTYRTPPYQGARIAGRVVMADIVVFGAGQIAEVAKVYIDAHSPDRIVGFTVDAAYRHANDVPRTAAGRLGAARGSLPGGIRQALGAAELSSAQRVPARTAP